MTATEVEALTELYETDETAWLETMAELAAQRRAADMDYEHLAEYLSDMARRDRREVRSRLTVLVAHLLKWDHQPERRSRSWKLTILEQRQELRGILDSKTLRRHAEEHLADIYADGVKRAAIETGLAVSAFPATCPYNLAQIEQGSVEDEPSNGQT